MVPWRSRDPAELIYVVAMCILFWASMLPEWRELLRLKRQGVLTDLQTAKEVRVLSRRGGGTAEQMTAADLLSALVSRLRKDTKS